jgi:hypothetical protein
VAAEEESHTSQLAPAVRSGEDHGAGRTEVRHLGQLDDQLTETTTGRLRAEAEVQDRGGAGVDLADDLDDDPTGVDPGERGDRQRPNPPGRGARRNGGEHVELLGRRGGVVGRVRAVSARG